jgi:hypothetical protein
MDDQSKFNGSFTELRNTIWDKKTNKKEVAKELLKLAIFMAKLSSTSFFGTEGQSIASFRGIAIDFAQKAIDVDPSINEQRTRSYLGGAASMKNISEVIQQEDQKYESGRYINNCINEIADFFITIYRDLYQEDPNPEAWTHI